MSEESNGPSGLRKLWWMVIGAGSLIGEKASVLAEELARRGELLDGPIKERAGKVRREVADEVRDSWAALRRSASRPVRAVAGVAVEDVEAVSLRVDDLEERLRSAAERPDSQPG